MRIRGRRLSFVFLLAVGCGGSSTHESGTTGGAVVESSPLSNCEIGAGTGIKSSCLGGGLEGPTSSGGSPGSGSSSGESSSGGGSSSSGISSTSSSSSTGGSMSSTSSSGGSPVRPMVTPPAFDPCSLPQAPIAELVCPQDNPADRACNGGSVDCAVNGSVFKPDHVWCTGRCEANTSCGPFTMGSPTAGHTVRMNCGVNATCTPQKTYATNTCMVCQSGATCSMVSERATASTFDCQDATGAPRSCDVTCGARSTCFVKCPAQGCKVACAAGAQCLVMCPDGRAAVAGAGGAFACP